MCIYLYIYINSVYINTCIQKVPYIYIYIYTCICIYIYIHINIYIQMYVYIYTRTYKDGTSTPIELSKWNEGQSGLLNSHRPLDVVGMPARLSNPMLLTL